MAALTLWPCPSSPAQIVFKWLQFAKLSAPLIALVSDRAGERLLLQPALVLIYRACVYVPCVFSACVCTCACPVVNICVHSASLRLIDSLREGFIGFWCLVDFSTPVIFCIHCSLEATLLGTITFINNILLNIRFTYYLMSMLFVGTSTLLEYVTANRHVVKIRLCLCCPPPNDLKLKLNINTFL